MTKLTYHEIQDRCENASKELTPALPTENTIEAWEEFLEAIEDTDDHSYELADAEAAGWDWCIYHHYGMEVIKHATNSELAYAEETYNDCIDRDADFIGVYETASAVAFHLLSKNIQENISGLCWEMKELAQIQIDNLEAS